MMMLSGMLVLAACKPAGPGGATAANAPAATAATSPAAVATVNGAAISKDVFEFYVKGTVGKAPSELTAEQREQLLDNLVRAQLVAQQAASDGLDKEGDTRSMLELARLNLLQQAASQHFLKDKTPTDQELHAEYDAQVAQMPKTQYHARHILVTTEDAAKKIIEQLKKGAKFADIAKRDSIDPSKQNGGDLGWFAADNMVKPFSDAVATLKKGEYTQQPVQTQYGWHVIRLEDTRDVPPPAFDTVKDRVAQLVKQKKFKTYVDELLKTAKIEKTP
jgi:peptidyl-prolyl cis-trans isomerase C